MFDKKLAVVIVVILIAVFFIWQLSFKGITGNLLQRKISSSDWDAVYCGPYGVLCRAPYACIDNQCVPVNSACYLDTNNDGVYEVYTCPDTTYANCKTLTCELYPCRNVKDCGGGSCCKDPSPYDLDSQKYCLDSSTDACAEDSDIGIKQVIKS